MNARKTISILLALLVMFSSTGFTLHKHYCLGALKSVSLSPQKSYCAEKWGLESDVCEMSCCKDTIDHLVADDFSSVAFEISLSAEWDFIPPFNPNCKIKPSCTETVKTDYSTFYPPPRIDLDIQVQHQSFLI